MLTNSSNKTNFKISVPSTVAMSLKSFVLHVQSGETPGFNIPVVEHPSGPKGIGRSNTPGSTIEYEPVTVRIICDEYLQSYKDVLRWMTGINDANNAKRYTNPVSETEFVQYHVLNNTKDDIVLTYNLIAAWPSNLSSIEYDYTEEGDPAITFTVTFNYRRVEVDGL